MAYPVLPDFDTSVFNPATLTPTELCNQLKRHYDYLMTAVATQKFKWDSVSYVYRSDGRCDYIDFKKSSITIRKRYYYSGNRLVSQNNFIKGVPPSGSAWQYVHGQTFNYNSSGFLQSITNKEQ